MQLNLQWTLTSGDVDLVIFSLRTSIVKTIVLIVISWSYSICKEAVVFKLLHEHSKEGLLLKTTNLLKGHHVAEPTCHCDSEIA